MTGIIEKRIQSLETSQSVSERVTIIRIIVVPGLPDAEPGSADVGGKTIYRADDETGEAFLARVKAEAKLAAKTGCSGVALVWPQSSERAAAFAALLPATRLSCTTASD